MVHSWIFCISMRYTELQVTTNFSFLRGASHPEEFVETAAAFGYGKIALTDHNTLAGVVRAFAATKGRNIKIIPGACLNFVDGPSLLVYPVNQQGYTEL